LIFKKWREALGGNIELILVGAAPLQPRLGQVFWAAGIRIGEAYGLTETTPLVSCSLATKKDIRLGYAGIIMDGIDVKLAEDGEILVKGPNVMMGYYNKPDITAEVIDAEGWFHTGDIGQMVEGQYLKITDRKKEIFKTSGGKYIAPQNMENTFKMSRFIEQIMIIGEGEKHPAAFIQPDFVNLRSWCEIKDIPYSSDSEMIKNERIIARFQKEIDRINEPFGNWEKVKKFALTPEVWSVELGHVTPTLKLRRKAIMARYADLYQNIYGG
jgi:long-chain acyl-CoA synthetase